MTEREGGGCILLNSYLLQLEVFFIELQLCLPILVVDHRAQLITSEKLTTRDASECRVPPAICKRKGGAKAPPVLPATSRSLRIFPRQQWSLVKVALKPDPELGAAFFTEDRQARELADAFADEPGRMTRDDDDYARKLLVVAADVEDAYLASGAANYVIGSVPGYKKLFLAFAGIDGDKRVSP